MSVVTLSAAGVEPVAFDGSQDATGFILRGLSGWLGTSSAKVDLVERAAGDGAHDVMDAQILYAARTVSVDYRLLPAGSADRDGLLAMQAMIRRMLHRTIAVRVQDAGSDLTATGYVDSIDVTQSAQNINRQYVDGQINIVCPRPELLSFSPQRLQLLPLSSDGEGLSYGDKLETWWTGEPNNSPSVLSVSPGSAGLVYPLDYGRDAGDGRNRGVVTNHGTSAAYPIVTIEGDFPDGVSLQLGGADTVTYEQPVWAAAPLVLDFRSRTASVQGADMTRWVTQRGFVPVPPSGSMSVVLRSQGSGYVTVQLPDTYV